MATGTGRLVVAMTIIGMAGGAWSLTHPSAFNPYQDLIELVRASKADGPRTDSCAGLGPLSAAMRSALRCPAVSVSSAR